MKAQMFNKQEWIEEVCPYYLRDFYKEKLEDAGFIILDMMEYFFEPYGYTLIFLLSESHLAIHTFPEENTTYVELTSCVEKPFNKFYDKIKI